MGGKMMLLIDPIFFSCSLPPKVWTTVTPIENLYVVQGFILSMTSSISSEHCPMRPEQIEPFSFQAATDLDEGEIAPAPGCTNFLWAEIE